MTEIKIRRRRRILLSVLILEILTLAFFYVFCALYVLSQLNIAYAVISFLILLIEILTGYVTFARLTNLYPLNDLDGNTFANLKRKHLTGRKVVLNIYKEKDGIWRIDDEFYFDMRGYVLPKIYICSYFIRNIHYPIINEKKLRLSALFRSQHCDRMQEFRIVFHLKSRAKECYVVKNGKTKTFPLRGFLIFCRFYLDAFDRHNRQGTKKISVNEDYYNSLKR